MNKGNNLTQDSDRYVYLYRHTVPLKLVETYCNKTPSILKFQNYLDASFRSYFVSFLSHTVMRREVQSKMTTLIGNSHLEKSKQAPVNEHPREVVIVRICFQGVALIER
jgi:hypothetical protein